MSQTPERRLALLARLGGTANGLGLLIPLIVLVGWAIGSDAMTRFFPGVIQMNPLTALLFLASGASLHVYDRQHGTRGPSPVPRVVGLLVGLVGLVVLAQFVIGVRDGIDRVLFRGALGTNAMALNTAVCFALLGTGLARLRRRPALAEAALSGVLFVAILALYGYLYKVDVLYQVGQRIAMAPHTAFTFALLASAALLVHARHGVAGRLASDGPGGSMTRSLLPVILVLPVVTGWVLLAGTRSDLFDMSAGFALLTAIVTGTVCTLVWRYAGVLDRQYDEGRRLARETQQARAAAQTAESRFRHAFDHASIGKALIGADGAWLEVNPAICRIVGYTEPELLACTFQDITHPDDLETDLDLVKQVYSGEIPSYVLEKRYFHKQGHIVWILLSVTAVRSAEGAFLYFVSEIQDITELKAATAELESARDAALDADRAKSEFLAVMSHEIRTPMNAVLGFGELLLGTPLTEEQQEYVAYINQGGEGLLRLINDILDLSKIEAGAVDIERRPFDLRSLVAAVNHTFRPQAVSKGLVLSARVDETVPALVVGDEHRIRQVLVNYVGNALKFTERGLVEVSVQGAPVAEGAAEVLLHIRVRDSGIGIPEERMDRLFKTFSQVDSSTTRRYGGTGLGLAIVKRLAELVGGHAWAESVVGQGSVFHFTARLETAALERPTREPGQSATPEVDRNMRILLAEDTESNKRLIQATLAHIGLAANVVSDGLQAVAAVVAAAGAGTPYDVVLMDVQMPVMDGIVAAREMRVALPEHQQPHIIAVTADALIGDRKRCLRAGVDDYLSKPFKPADFASALTRSRGSMAQRS